MLLSLSWTKTYMFLFLGLNTKWLLTQYLGLFITSLITAHAYYVVHSDIKKGVV